MSVAVFSFRVPTRWHGLLFGERFVPTHWLGPDGEDLEALQPPLPPPANGQPPREPADNWPEEAVQFTFRLNPTMRDERQIDLNYDEVCGDLDTSVDLDIGIDNAWSALRDDIEAELWPEGRPKTTDPEELKREEKMIDQLYAAPDYATRRAALARMNAMRDRQRVMAEWPVLIVGAPSGWEDVAARPLRRGLAATIAIAYKRAQDAAESAAGKAQRSEP